MFEGGQQTVENGASRLDAILIPLVRQADSAQDRLDSLGFRRFLDERGIAIRAGDLAALPLLKRMGVTRAARASCYLYTTMAEVDRFADALDAVAG